MNAAQLSRIQEQEGLKTAGISGISIDHQGFLWLTNNNMVQRFDGRHTLKFSFDENVYGIFCDSRDQKWVITRTQVFFFSPQAGRFQLVPSADSTPTLQLFERSDKRVYLLRSNGHFVFDEKDSVFERAAPYRPAPDRGYNRIFTNYGGTEFFCSNDSIYAFDPAENKVYTMAFINKLSIAPAGDKQLLVSTTRYETILVDLLSSKRLSLERLPRSHTASLDYPVVFASTARNDSIQLLATNRGLWNFNMRSRTLSSTHYLYQGQPLQQAQSIRQLYTDRFGRTFLSHADGLFFFSAKQNQVQYIRNSGFYESIAADNDVRDFDEEPDGRMVMATTNGIARFDPATGSVTKLTHQTSGQAFDYPSQRQVVSHGKYLLIGTAGNGLWILDKQTNRFSRPLPYPAYADEQTTARFNSTYVWKIVRLINGQYLIAGGGRSYLLDIDAMRYQPTPGPSFNGNTRSAMQDGAGRIWYGTANGLTVTDSNYRKLFHIVDSFADKRVAAITAWKADIFFIGTRGMYKVVAKGNTLVEFRRCAGFPDERFVYCMAKDSNGILWAGTEDGLYRYDPVKDEAQRFGKSDHVQDHAFNSDGAFFSSKGIMYMGGQNGFNFFRPETVAVRQSVLQPLLVSFAVSGEAEQIDFSQPLSLSYDQRDIDFVMSAPFFEDPFAVQFRYKLGGDDEEWQHNGYNDRVRISQVPPGKYLLKIAASTDGNSWYESSQLVAFTIAAPFWQQWWFRLLAIAAALSGLAGMRYWRRRKREKSEMDRVVNYFTLSGHEHMRTTDILWDIARNCVSRLGFEDCVIYLVDEERKALVQQAAFGGKSPGDFEIKNPIEIPMGMGITGAAATSGVTQLVKDTTSDSRYIVDDVKRLSELAVPIVYNAKVIGVIDSENRKRNFFKRRHREVVEKIAAVCASKIARALALEQVMQAEQKMLTLNTRMEEAKFLNLRLQMNPLFLFNTLTSIQYLVVSGQTSKAINYLNVFSKFLRALLQFAERTVVTLDEEVNMIDMYVELESLSLDESFSYTIAVDESIDSEDTLVPFMILQPFVENAIHHGLIHRLGEKRFSIDIRNQHDDCLECIIEDNGVGRQKAGEIKAHKMRAARHESKGVGIVQQRLELLHQKTGKPGDIIYEDLFDDIGQPAGTRVVITIPYYENVEL